MVVKKILNFVLGFVSLIRTIFRRMICRISGKGRRNSGMILPMTSDNVSIPQQSVPLTNEVELESWDAWTSDFNGQSNNTPQDGRVRRYSSRDSDPEPQPEPDFFQGMQPEVKKPAKILIRKRDDRLQSMSNRLSVNADLLPTQGDELGVWDEDTGAWGEEVMEDLTWAADHAVREKRKLDREMRQQEQLQKKMQRDATKNFQTRKLAQPINAKQS